MSSFSINTYPLDNPSFSKSLSPYVLTDDPTPHSEIDLNQLEKSPNKLLQFLLVLKQNTANLEGLKKEIHESNINVLKNRVLNLYTSNNNNHQLSPYHYSKLLLNFPDLIKTAIKNPEEGKNFSTQILNQFKKIHANPSDLKNLKRGEKFMEIFLNKLRLVNEPKQLQELVTNSMRTIFSEDNQPFIFTNIYRWARIPTFRPWLLGEFQPPKGKMEGFSLNSLKILDHFLLTSQLPNHLLATDKLKKIDQLIDLYQLSNYCCFDDLAQVSAEKIVECFSNSLTKKWQEVFCFAFLEDQNTSKTLLNCLFWFLKKRLGIFFIPGTSELKLKLESTWTKQAEKFIAFLEPYIQEVSLDSDAARHLLSREITFSKVSKLYIHHFNAGVNLTHIEYGKLGILFPNVRILQIPEWNLECHREQFDHWKNVIILFVRKNMWGTDGWKNSWEKDSEKQLLDYYSKLFQNSKIIKLVPEPLGYITLEKKATCFHLNIPDFPKFIMDVDIEPLLNTKKENFIIRDAPLSRGFPISPIDFFVHKSINLSGCTEITGEWILSLNPIQKSALRELDIRGCTNISPKRIEEIKNALPNCTVLHDPSKKRELEVVEENSPPSTKRQKNGKGKQPSPKGESF